MDITESLTKILLFGQKKTPQALQLLACGVLTLYSNSIVPGGLLVKS